MTEANGHIGSAQSLAFPQELRSGLLRSLDVRFTVIFGLIVLASFSGVYVLSRRPVQTASVAQQVTQIQERYAQLVLNQPKPAPVKPEAEAPARRPGKAEAETQAPQAEQTRADRAKESLVQRAERRERTSGERQARRQAMDQKIASVGIFAEITSAGSGDDDDAGGVQDLMATGGVKGDLSGLAVSGGSFARKSVNVEEVRRERRETRTTAGTIAQSTLSKAEEEKVARRGNVNISETPQAVEGSAKQAAERTHEAIGNVIKSQQAQLVYVLEKWLKKDPNLSGKILLRFTIMPSGSVTNITVVSSTTNNPEFDEAITRYVKRWSFAPIDPGSGSVTVVYPFVFTGVR